MANQLVLGPDYTVILKSLVKKEIERKDPSQNFHYMQDLYYIYNVLGEYYDNRAK